MTRFRDELQLIAAQAPEVDLAERVVRGARRRKAATLGSAVASLVAAALTATVLITTPNGASMTSGEIANVLPASGVDPAAYAYYDFCGRQWDYRKNTHTFAGQECAQWRLVTRTGGSFRMPEALSVYTEQVPENYMNTGGPLAISSDGKRVAYYSEKDQKFAVRDLADGRIWLTPQTVTRETMVKNGTLLILSPDGRFLGLPSRTNSVVDMETGQVAEIPKGWHVRRIGNGGSPVVVSDGKDRLGLFDDGKVTPLNQTSPQVGELSADGRTLVYLDGQEVKDHVVTHDFDTIVTLDLTTGKVLSRAKFTDVPEGFRFPRIGGWHSPTEVVLSDVLRDMSWGGKKDGVPTLGEVTYAIDVNTGRIRKLAEYTYKAWSGDLIVPGF
ncbi:hypothetical protein ACIBQ1_53025 [Nonomuraea sp. NPDC050153]|uniref:hypothetical protein n=1 Tax=Nonomuraea sp. NPDC050153 TaxID=3364359 RepID=UPI0037A77886